MPRKPARTSIGVVAIDEFVSSVAMVATRSESALQKGICARCKAVIMRAERGPAVVRAARRADPAAAIFSRFRTYRAKVF